MVDGSVHCTGGPTVCRFRSQLRQQPLPVSLASAWWTQCLVLCLMRWKSWVLTVRYRCAHLKEPTAVKHCPGHFPQEFYQWCFFFSLGNVMVPAGLPQGKWPEFSVGRFPGETKYTHTHATHKVSVCWRCQWPCQLLTDGLSMASHFGIAFGSAKWSANAGEQQIIFFFNVFIGCDLNDREWCV